MSKFPITSTLSQIATLVFQAKDLKEAQQITVEHLNKTKIKDTDKTKMIIEINNQKNLIRLQTYICNALLKYESLGLSQLNKPISNKTESVDENIEL
jgi:hypothetical protein